LKSSLKAPFKAPFKGMMGSAGRLLPLLVLAAGVASCSDSPTAPSNYAAYSQTDLTVGTGGDAVSGRLLTVNYTGWFYGESRPEKKGPVFDSSAGGEPFTFTLGAGQVIAGWDRGVQGMRVGGVRRLIVPPSLAYGTVRNGPIPPNATLVFEIELLDVQ
jgi:FKBP-type peptidyl-prolyl cis-trans isomerase FkpA